MRAGDVGGRVMLSECMHLHSDVQPRAEAVASGTVHFGSRSDQLDCSQGVQSNTGFRSLIWGIGVSLHASIGCQLTCHVLYFI